MLKRLLIAFVLSNALLGAAYFIPWYGDESAVQLTTNSDNVDHGELEGGPALAFTILPANPAGGVVTPANSARPLYQTRVAYSPPSRAPPTRKL